MKRAAFLLGIAVTLVLSLAHRSSVRAQATQADASLPVYNAGGTAIPNAHAVVGHLKASRGGDTVTLTGPAVFSGAESYSCTISIERGGPVAGNVINIDGGHFRILASLTSGGWREDFICVGN
jgi:hypothetical protein